MTYLKLHEIDRDTLIVSSSLEFDQNTIEMLHTAGIRTFENLIDMSEVAVCRALLADDLGYGMSNELARDAVRRFMELRGRMDRLGYGFAGPRHTESYLFEQVF